MLAIAREPIDTIAIEQSVRSEQFGGVVTFLGVVRCLSDDLREVEALEYEAHEEMAVAEFEKIASEAVERYGPCSISAVHRVGELAIGDIAVAVSAGAPHRAQAFDACRYVIDEIKSRAPIWKKERYAAGGSSWRENAGNAASSAR